MRTVAGNVTLTNMQHSPMKTEYLPDCDAGCPLLPMPHIQFFYAHLSEQLLAQLG